MKQNVVGVVGGLGNQLFQLAFARWLEQQTGKPSSLDLSAYRSVPKYLALQALPFRYQERKGLQKVPYPGGKYPRLATISRKLLAPRKIVFETNAVDLKNLNAVIPDSWYYGYWQIPAVVRSVLPELQLEYSRVRPCALQESIGVHVRRGDMLGRKSELPLHYYDEALRRLRNENSLPSTFPVSVYSDDIEWCKRQSVFASAEFSRFDNQIDDFMSLSGHKYLVLSGSTFSWWSAQLVRRESLTVCAPYPFDPGTHRLSELFDDNWVKIDRSDFPAANPQ